MLIVLKEGVRFEDAKIPGFVVRRQTDRVLVAYPKPSAKRRKAAPRAGCSPMARVAELWARVDVAGAEAWRAYAVAMHRRSGKRGKAMSAYNAFVKAVFPVVNRADGTEPSLVPPAVPASKRAPRRRARGQGEVFVDGGGI